MNNVKKVCRLALLCLSISTLVACSSLSEKTSSSSSENQTEASSSSSEKKGLLAKAKEKLSSGDFNPQDVSDATIESIKTYEDYWIMNEKIIDNYYTEADEAFKGTVLEDSAAIQELKDSTKKEMEDLKKNMVHSRKHRFKGKKKLLRL